MADREVGQLIRGDRRGGRRSEQSARARDEYFSRTSRSTLACVASVNGAGSGFFLAPGDASRTCQGSKNLYSRLLDDPGRKREKEGGEPCVFSRDRGRRVYRTSIERDGLIDVACIAVIEWDFDVSAGRRINAGFIGYARIFIIYESVSEPA